MIWFGISLAVGFVWFSFVTWRKLREDYPEEEVLLTTVALTLAGFLGSGLGRYLWGAVGAILIVLILWCYKKKWNFWEWLDEVAIQSLVVGILPSLVLKTWVILGVLVGGYILSLLVKRFYRSWHWYKSGKQGFVGIISSLVWGLVVAITLSGGVYWAGWFLTTAIIIIYLRSGHKLWTR